jgi:hypothetical protein
MQVRAVFVRSDVPDTLTQLAQQTLDAIFIHRDIAVVKCYEHRAIRAPRHARLGHALIVRPADVWCCRCEGKCIPLPSRLVMLLYHSNHGVKTWHITDPDIRNVS